VSRPLAGKTSLPAVLLILAALRRLARCLSGQVQGRCWVSLAGAVSLLQGQRVGAVRISAPVRNTQGVGRSRDGAMNGIACAARRGVQGRCGAAIGKRPPQRRVAQSTAGIWRVVDGLRVAMTGRQGPAASGRGEGGWFGLRDGGQLVARRVGRGHRPTCRPKRALPAWRSVVAQGAAWSGRNWQRLSKSGGRGRAPAFGRLATTSRTFLLTGPLEGGKRAA